MTRPLDPEIKALRAIHRAIRDLDLAARRRALLYFTAREHGVVQGDIRIYGAKGADDG